MSPGLAHSVQVRLVRHAQAMGVDPNLVLVRYAAERFLYRLGCSPHAPRFVLKGALLLLIWLGERIRPTRDVDLLGSGELSAPALGETISEICTLEVEPDGLEFDLRSIQVRPIRAGNRHGGQRVTVLAHLGRARIRIQVDVGIGDVVVPEPEELDYPSLLDMPRPRLRAYRPETVVAEKLHAMVVLGANNSRLRDFFDVLALSEGLSFQGGSLSRAIVSTFRGRHRDLPHELPLALTPPFADLPGKREQWEAFLRRSRLSPAGAELTQVLRKIARFAGPALVTAARGHRFQGFWPAGGPWEEQAGIGEGPRPA